MSSIPPPPLIDIGVNLADRRFDKDRPATIQRAFDAGVTAMVVTGTSLKGSQDAAALAGRYPGELFSTAGVHPHGARHVTPATLGALRGLAAQPQVVAIGECGLDKSTGRLSLQIRLLREQLQVARELDLPVLLHCVKAHGALLSLLQEVGPLQGVMHSYSGSPEMVPAFAKLGLCFSFGGVLSWEGAKKPKLALQRVPPGRLLVESDGPDQPLSRRQGQTAPKDQRSEPADVEDIAAIARALGAEPGWGPFRSSAFQ